MLILTCIGGPTGTPLIRTFVVVPEDVGDAGLLDYNLAKTGVDPAHGPSIPLKSVVTCVLEYRQAVEKNLQMNFQMNYHQYR